MCNKDNSMSNVQFIPLTKMFYMKKLAAEEDYCNTIIMALLRKVLMNNISEPL